MQIDISILIVSYNTREITLECIRSVFEQTKNVSFEVVVVDNLSDDGSADAIEAEFPDVRLIRSQENLGFAKGNNLAATQANGEYILLLNPDTIVLEDAISQLTVFARSDGGDGIYGGRTLFKDGSLNPYSCWQFMTLWSVFCQGIGLTSMFRQSSLFNHEAFGNWQRDNERVVDMVTGCFLLIRRKLWNQLDGFDDSFFMYAEEADLCYRAGELGALSYFTPSATIIHYGGASERTQANKIIKVFSGKIHFIRKHWGQPRQRLGIFLFEFHTLARLIAYSVLNVISRNEFRTSSKETWKAIWQARKEWSKGYTN